MARLGLLARVQVGKPATIRPRRPKRRGHLRTKQAITIRGRIRLFFGAWFQRMAWRLCDPYDSWLIDYHNEDGHRCSQISTGFYNSARARAKDLGGKIVGCSAETVEA